ncbi:MAG: ATP-binding protein, partial [Kangiellaceae bacterium]|nr:ATP-binding protein [Kangiellaceae bacterium]
LLNSAPLHFESLSDKDGLSQNSVIDILKDHQGYLWFATQDGLNRYDGYKITVYKHDSDDDTSISDNYIWVLLEDKEGFIWAGTRNGGLNRYDPKTGYFTAFRHDPQDESSISSDQVTSLFIDSRDQFWVGTASGGLNLFDRKKKKFKRFLHDPKNTNSIGGNSVKSIAEDQSGHLWLGLSHVPLRHYPSAGLDRFNIDTQSFQHFRHDPADPSSISGDHINFIYVDPRGYLWVSAFGQGLNRIDPDTNQIKRFYGGEQSEHAKPRRIHQIIPGSANTLWLGSSYQGLYEFNKNTGEYRNYQKSSDDENSLQGISIYSLLLDNNILWTGSWRFGISKTDLNSRQFYKLRKSSIDHLSLPYQSVSAINSSNNKIYFANDSGGIIQFDKRSKKLVVTPPEAVYENSKVDRVKRIFIDSENQFWISHHKIGLFQYNEGYQSKKRFQFDNPVMNTSGNLQVNAYIADEDGNIWLGTRSKGLIYLNKATGEARQFVHDPEDPNSISSDSIPHNGLLFDPDGNLWIATIGGLNFLEKGSEVFQRIPLDGEVKLSHQTVTSIFLNPSGVLWVGTQGGGINRLVKNARGLKIEHFTSKDGLISDAVGGLYESRDGKLWISTAKGISRFDYEKKLFHNFLPAEGVLPAYLIGSHHMDKDGIIYFGGPYGVTFFDPLKIKVPEQLTKVLITDFLLANKSSKVSVTASDTAQQYRADQIDEITLGYQDIIFGLEFSSLDFRYSKDAQFAYKMEGFNQDWIYTDSLNRRAVYTNLDSGVYEFNVTTVRSNGSLNTDIKKVAINIQPAPWKSFWAYAFYAFAVATLLILLIAQRYKTSLAVEKRRYAEAANKAKSYYLASMSHEIRTPLNGVIGAASLLNECHLEKESKSYSEIIQHSAESLLLLVNDILDLSKIESGMLTLEQRQFNLRECIENTLDIFTNVIEEKKIELCFIADDNVPEEIVSDFMRLRQVITNLVSNAIKFTQGGFVKVYIRTEQQADSGFENLSFYVEDSGIGMSQEEQKNVFKKFMQAKTSTFRKYGGTGLGLSICQQIITLMGSSIEVESEEEKGTKFSFSIKVKTPKETAKIYSIATSKLLKGKTILALGCNIHTQQILDAFALYSKVKISYMEISDLISGNNIDTTPDIILLESNYDKNVIENVTNYMSKNNALSRCPKVILCSPSYAKELQPTKILSQFNQIIYKPIKIRQLKTRLESIFQKTNDSLSSERIPEISFKSQYPLDILLAEDNVVNQKVFQKCMQKLGYEADTVSDGVEALDALKRKKYDVIFTDLQMPNLDGLGLIEKLNEDYAKQSILIVLCTADVLQDFGEMKDAALIHDFLAKPYRLDELKECLMKLYENQLN